MTRELKTAGGWRGPLPLLSLVALVGASILWANWPTLRDMAHRWSTDARYSHGYLVPMFAAALLWMRRDRLVALAPRPSWWGVPIIAAGSALQLTGALFYIDWLQAVALLPYAAGLSVLFCGPRSLQWSGPAVGFLFFMLPMPFRLEIAMGGLLQRVATLMSTYAMQTLGLSALAEGNIIIMDEARLGVAEVCSGLSMMFMFFSFSAGVALLVQRRWTDKLLIVLSAIPIAVIANVTRITVTGILHETVGSRLANLVFHDLAGWLMMPLALGLLWAELLLLSHLLIEPAPDEGAPVFFVNGTGGPSQLGREPQERRRLKFSGR